MNTIDLKRFVYNKASEIFDPPLTHNDVHILTSIFFDGIAHCTVLTAGRQSLAPGKEHNLNIRSFGKFTVRKRKGRVYTVRGEQYTKDDRYTVVFQPGSDLKRALEEIPLPKTA